MSFSKLRHGKEEIFETRITDIDGKEMEKWKVHKRDYPKVVKILNEKFGLGMKVFVKKRDKDLDWAFKNS